MDFNLTYRCIEGSPNKNKEPVISFPGMFRKMKISIKKKTINLEHLEHDVLIFWIILSTNLAHQQNKNKN